jgi:hypothetical protein
MMELVINDRGAFLTYDLPDVGVVDIVPLTFGQARIVVSASREDLCSRNEF